MGQKYATAVQAYNIAKGIQPVVTERTGYVFCGTLVESALVAFAWPVRLFPKK